MSVEPKALLIVANSGRAMAESALRAGYQIAVLDRFCDLDTRAMAPCSQLLDAAGAVDPELMLARAARILPPQDDLGLVYGAGLEHAPSALRRLAGRHRLFGNSAEVLDLLRDAKRFFGLLDSLAIPHPEIRFTATDPGSGRWLLKQAGSSGGEKVERWCERQPLSNDNCYLQRHLDGPAMSALFVADGSKCRVIGYNRLRVAQIPGAQRPFLYAGATSHAPLGQAARCAMRSYIDALVGELGLRGVNSLDFVMQRGRPLVLELNARPSATLELYEQSVTEGWLKAHVQACLGRLPDTSLAQSGLVHGHRICYAAREMCVPEDARWPHWTKDLPVPGSCIARGQPLCSVFARGSDTAAVEARLQQRQRRVDGMTAVWPGSAAREVEA